MKMIILIPIYLILIGDFTYGFERIGKDYCPSVILANYSVAMNITVNDKNESIIHFPVSTSKYPYRVYASSKMAQPDYPVFIMVRQQREVTSWEIPLLVESKTETLSFFNTSRTLCHNDMEAIAHQTYGDNEYYKQLSVSISTFSSTSVTVTLLVKDQEDFYIDLNKNYTTLISPSSPKYFYYRYSKNDSNFEDTVILDIYSLDVTCFIVSIQNYECPVFDLNEDIKYDGEYETINTRGGIIVKKEHFPNGFFVIFVAKPDDFDCDGDNLLPNNKPKKIKPLNHTSVITFTIKKNITPQEYVFAIVLTAVGILCFCGLFAIVTGTFYLCEINWRTSEKQRCELKAANNKSIVKISSKSTINIGTNTDVCTDNNEENTSTCNITVDINADASSHNRKPIQEIASTSTANLGINPGASTSKLDEFDEIDTENDTVSLLPKSGTNENTGYRIVQPNIVPSTGSVDVVEVTLVNKFEYIDILLKKSHLKLSDLATKTSKILNSESRHYFCHVITVGIFYGTPVVQLVITHQRIMNITGNLDMCYYNFLCAHPLGSTNDFNHIFSNLGYIFAGILFLSITAIRDWRLSHIDNFGIPKHYGFFYAMGTAVIMVGVLSACYHICPSQENFQFDTSFMYVIAVLSLVKLYQNRHPDINAMAHVVFLLLSLATLITVIGIFENNIYLWGIFIVVYSGVCIFIALKIYFINNIIRGYQLFREIEINDLHSFLQAIKPVKMARFCFLSIALLINIIVAFMGFSFQIHDTVDFGTFLLIILMMNTFGYYIAYIIFKIIYHEPFSIQSILYIILSAISWGLAIVCFLNHSMKWTGTAAESRQINTHCILHIKFYDYHDVWHLLSATALYFSCMLLLTLDDKLIYTPHSDIYIF